MLRRWRNRFGISAHRVAVRTHLPWHWRALSIITLAGAALALAGWIYDTGRQFAGFDQSSSDRELSEMQEQAARLGSELELARKTANSSESRLRIEATTQERLATQIKTLEEENTRLKADLAMFENLAGGHVGNAGLAMSQLQILPVGTEGEYRYRLMLVQTGDKKQLEFRGALQLIATVQRGKETVTIQFPVAGDGSADQYQVSFHYFRRLEGVFKVPTGTQLRRIEVRLIKNGVIKASQVVVL